MPKKEQVLAYLHVEGLSVKVLTVVGFGWTDTIIVLFAEPHLLNWVHTTKVPIIL